MRSSAWSWRWAASATAIVEAEARVRDLVPAAKLIYIEPDLFPLTVG
ncbi:hypothetical protein [Rhodococcus spongiicola]|nr:hypothetical protein [Rhodococcus spongiicola]